MSTTPPLLQRGQLQRELEAAQAVQAAYVALANAVEAIRACKPRTGSTIEAMHDRSVKALAELNRANFAARRIIHSGTANTRKAE